MHRERKLRVVHISIRLNICVCCGKKAQQSQRIVSISGNMLASSIAVILVLEYMHFGQMTKLSNLKYNF